jgi:hypothetical protein
MRTRAQPQTQVQREPQRQQQTQVKRQEPRRHNLNWSINENLRLQREYELLGLNTKQIALLHERTESSIINRLVTENLIENRQDARRN